MSASSQPEPYPASEKFLDRQDVNQFDHFYCGGWYFYRSDAVVKLLDKFSKEQTTTKAPVDWNERRKTMPEVQCPCGLMSIPSGLDGVQWYWQRHAREGCTLELPNKMCWCGLLRSEHLDGHKPGENTSAIAAAAVQSSEPSTLRENGEIK